MSLPAYLQKHIAPGTRFWTVPEPFTLECGRSLEGLQVAYQTWGKRQNASRSTILICHALTGSADVDAWWPGIIGRGRAFDPEYDYVICSNILGGCYGTTGPANLKTASNERYRADFPSITIRDMVRLQSLLLDHLGIDRIHLVTGPSLGGMQALEWAVSFSERVETLVPIGVGGRHSAWCIGGSEAQRAAIAVDPNWKGGYYSDDERPRQGLAAARMMAVCGYRSAQSFDERFGRDRNDADEFQVQSYLHYQGEKFVDRFDANAYVALTHAMHTHDLARGRGAFADVIANIRQPALVVSVSSDGLYPPCEQQELAKLMPNASYRVLDSTHGHDGFLIETETLAEHIRAFRSDSGQSGALRAAS